MFFGCMGQLAPTTLPQRRLDSTSRSAGLSLSVLLPLRPPQGVCLFFFFGLNKFKECNVSCQATAWFKK